MKNNKVKEAKKLLEEMRQSITKRPSPLARMNENEAIEYLRKIREKLWEEKLASPH